MDTALFHAAVCVLSNKSVRRLDKMKFHLERPTIKFPEGFSMSSSICCFLISPPSSLVLDDAGNITLFVHLSIYICILHSQVHKTPRTTNLKIKTTLTIIFTSIISYKFNGRFIKSRNTKEQYTSRLCTSDNSEKCKLQRSSMSSSF